jgi:hypothetical protein
MAKVKRKDLEEGVADLLGGLLELELVLPDEGGFVGHKVFTGATYDIKNRDFDEIEKYLMANRADGEK